MVRQRSAKPSSPVQIRLPPFNTICRCGGIGRRAGLKIQCPRGRAGSTPAAGITKETSPERWFPSFSACFFGSLSNGADVRHVCFAPRDICTPVKLGFAEVQMSLTPLNSGERPLTGTERLDCFRTSGESLLIGGTELSSLSSTHPQTFIVPICTP